MSAPLWGRKTSLRWRWTTWPRVSCSNQTPYTPGEEGLQDHRIMEAIYESARTGKPVKLPNITTRDTFRGSEPTE